MDVHHDLVPRRFQPAHGFHQDVAGGGLDDVLHEFGAVALQPQPLFLFAHTFVGDGLAAIAVDAHLGLHIHQLSAGGEHDEHHAALVEEADAVRLGGDSGPDAGGGGTVYIPPELHDAGVGLPPCVHQGLQLLLGQAVVQRTHGFQRPTEPP